LQAGGHRFDPVQLHQGWAVSGREKLWDGCGVRTVCRLSSVLCPLLFDIVDRFVWPAFGGVFGGGVISRALIAWAGREEVLSVPFVDLDGRAGWPLRCGIGERIKRLRAFGECLGTERR
jgi:hypothetical protein